MRETVEWEGLGFDSVGLFLEKPEPYTLNRVLGLGMDTVWRLENPKSHQYLMAARLRCSPRQAASPSGGRLLR